jgi:hypothetical protein
MKQNIKADHTNAFISNKSGRLGISSNEKNDLLDKNFNANKYSEITNDRTKNEHKIMINLYIKETCENTESPKNNTQYVKIIRKRLERCFNCHHY